MELKGRESRIHEHSDVYQKKNYVVAILKNIGRSQFLINACLPYSVHASTCRL